MRVIEQSIAATVVFLLVDSTSHVTGITGATPAVKISKNGGAGATATGSVTAVDATNNPGWYKLTLTTTETNTLGDLVLSATATGADPTDRLLVVESATLSTVDTVVDAVKAKTDNLPAAPAATGAAMTLTSAYDAAKTAATQSSVSAIPTSPLLASDARLNNLDATISSRNATTPPTVAQIDTQLSGTHGAVTWVDSGATSLASIATASNVTAAQVAVIAALPAAPDNAGIDTLLATVALDSTVAKTTAITALSVQVGSPLQATDRPAGDYPTAITYSGTYLAAVTWNSGKVWTYHYNTASQLTGITEV